jgi:hypothetical protein
MKRSKPSSSTNPAIGAVPINDSDEAATNHLRGALLTQNLPRIIFLQFNLNGELRIKLTWILKRAHPLLKLGYGHKSELSSPSILFIPGLLEITVPYILFGKVN